MAGFNLTGPTRVRRLLRSMRLFTDSSEWEINFRTKTGSFQQHLRIKIRVTMMMRFISILRVCKIAVITHTEPLAKIRIAKIPAD